MRADEAAAAIEQVEDRCSFADRGAGAGERRPDQRAGGGDISRTGEGILQAQAGVAALGAGIAQHPFNCLPLEQTRSACCTA